MSGTARRSTASPKPQFGCDGTVGKLLDQFDISHQLYRR